VQRVDGDDIVSHRLSRRGFSRLHGHRPTSVPPAMPTCSPRRTSRGRVGHGQPGPRHRDRGVQSRAAAPRCAQDRPLASRWLKCGLRIVDWLATLFGSHEDLLLGVPGLHESHILGRQPMSDLTDQSLRGARRRAPELAPNTPRPRQILLQAGGARHVKSGGTR